MTSSMTLPMASFKENIATLGHNDLMSLMQQRHSVRKFNDRSIEDDVRKALEERLRHATKRAIFRCS